MSRTSIPLTQAEAFLRSSIIEPKIKYKLFFCLKKGDVYQGWSEIKFNATNKVSFFQTSKVANQSKRSKQRKRGPLLSSLGTPFRVSKLMART